MVRHGSPPYLECSSRGDKRFSAFFAKVNGRSIESQYQAAKVFEDGTTGLSWREAKGRKPVNIDQVTRLYNKLWEQYLLENPHLLTVLREANGLQDTFGQAGHNCQATVLWELRERL